MIFWVPQKKETWTYGAMKDDRCFISGWNITKKLDNITYSHQNILQTSRHLSFNAFLKGSSAQTLILHQSWERKTAKHISHCWKTLFMPNSFKMIVKYKILCLSWATLLWQRMSMNLLSSVPHFFSPASYKICTVEK